MSYLIDYKAYGECSILLTWPAKIDEAILNDIIRVKQLILDKEADELLDINNGYNSLLLSYNSTIKSISKIKLIQKIINSREVEKLSISSTTWEIPVCYHESFGTDLRKLAVAKKLTIKQLITKHIAPKYKVYCKGFLPGFMYLGGLDEQLHFPRKASPEVSVPKNSVAIGGAQTGIYPSESPGGWHIIGRTPVSLFDVSKPKISKITVGDSVKLSPISLADFLAFEAVEDPSQFIKRIGSN